MTETATKLPPLQEGFVRVFKIKGKGAGKESMQDMPKEQWEHLQKRNPLNAEDIKAGRTVGSFCNPHAEGWRMFKTAEEAQKVESIIVPEEKTEAEAEAEVLAMLAENEKLGEIPDSTSEKEPSDEQKKFNEHITNAEKFVVSKDTDSALKEYELASKIFPKEKYPKDQIAKLKKSNTN